MDQPTLQDVDEAFEAVRTRRASTACESQATKALWRTHHHPHRYERCTTIRGALVCRRCSWMYPTAIIAALISSWVSLPDRLDVVMVWALALPATVEFALGELGRLSYDPRRQIAVTIPLGIAIGRGAAAELADTGTWLWWGPALVYGSIWFAVAVYAWMTHRGQYV